MGLKTFTICKEKITYYHTHINSNILCYYFVSFLTLSLKITFKNFSHKKIENCFSYEIKKKIKFWLAIDLIISSVLATLEEVFLIAEASPQGFCLAACNNFLRNAEILHPWAHSADLYLCQDNLCHHEMSPGNKILCACQIWKSSE